MTSQFFPRQSIGNLFFYKTSMFVEEFFGILRNTLGIPIFVPWLQGSIIVFFWVSLELFLIKNFLEKVFPFNVMKKGKLRESEKPPVVIDRKKSREQKMLWKTERKFAGKFSRLDRFFLFFLITIPIFSSRETFHQFGYDF
jgi:hypothetical protein